MMTKKNKIVIAVLACVLVLTTAAAVITNSGLMNRGISTSSGKSLSSLEVSEFTSEYPLVESAHKGLFYEVYPDGKIKFYDFKDGSFTEHTDGVKKKTVTLVHTYQKIEMTLWYLKTGSGTVGYGLFNSGQTDKPKHYSYIFARLMDCPESYKKTARTEYVIATASAAQDVYNTDKVYSDLFSYDMDSGKTLLVVSSRDRTLTEDATYRTDWTIFTDSSLNSMKKYDLFASGRYYDSKAENRQYDFMSVVNSRALRRANATTFVNSPSYVIREHEGAYYCFANTDKGFDLVKNGKKDKPLASFDGSFSGYSVSGNWILDKAALRFTNIVTGEEKTVKKADFNELSGFVANDAGTKFVLFCNGEKQSMVIYDTEADTAEIITDNIYGKGIGNFAFIDDDTLFFSAYDSMNKAINRTVKL